MVTRHLAWCRAFGVEVRGHCGRLQRPARAPPLAWSYYEVTTEQYKRLDDVGWARQVVATPAPSEPEWMKPLLP